MGGKTHPPYPDGYREEAVRALRSGRQPDELGRELGVSGQTLRNRLKQADLDDGVRSDGLTSDERAELSRLRREVHRLRQDHRHRPGRFPHLRTRLERRFAGWNEADRRVAPFRPPDRPVARGQ